MRKFFKESWAVIGYLLGLIGTFVTIFTLSKKITIAVSWLIIAAIVCISSIVIAVMATLKLSKIICSGIQHEITAYGKDKNQDMYYTNYSKNLRIGTVVTIYYTKPFSKMLGFGVVHNSSVDEYTEIRVLHIEEEFADIYEQSKTNSRKVLQDMYILPNTYIEKLPMIIKILNGGDI